MGGGSFVVEVDSQVTIHSLLNDFYFKNLSIKHLSEVRKMVEPYSAAVAARNFSEKDIEKLGQLNDAANHYIKENNFDEAVKYEIAFHMLISEQTRNPLLTASHGICGIHSRRLQKGAGHG